MKIASQNDSRPSARGQRSGSTAQRPAAFWIKTGNRKVNANMGLPRELNWFDYTENQPDCKPARNSFEEKSAFFV
jgi:hypothetical protein